MELCGREPSALGKPDTAFRAGSLVGEVRTWSQLSQRGVIFSIWLVALADNVETFTGEDLLARDNLRARRKFRYGDGSVAAQFNIRVFLPSGQARFQRRHVERKSITRQETTPSERECSEDIGYAASCNRVLIGTAAFAP